MIQRLNFDQIKSITDRFEKAHNGYRVTWHTIDSPLETYGICFRVTSNGCYVLKENAAGADGVPRMSMEPDEMCISIARSVSTWTLFGCALGPEYIIERTLGQMVDEIEDYRKCGKTGNWILPDN